MTGSNGEMDCVLRPPQERRELLSFSARIIGKSVGATVATGRNRPSTSWLIRFCRSCKSLWQTVPEHLRGAIDRAPVPTVPSGETRQFAMAGMEFRETVQAMIPQRTPHTPAYACMLTTKSKSTGNGATRFIETKYTSHRKVRNPILLGTFTCALQPATGQDRKKPVKNDRHLCEDAKLEEHDGYRLDRTAAIIPGPNERPRIGTIVKMLECDSQSIGKRKVQD